MILNTIFYYVMYCSVFLLYGVGLNRLLALRESMSSLVLMCIKTLLSATATAALSYLVAGAILVPVHLDELYPFVIVLIYACISVIIEVFVSIGANESVTELTIPLLTLILALAEGATLVQTVIIVCACVIAFYLLVAIVSSLRMRFDSFAPKSGFAVYTMLLISLAVITIALCAWNVSWLTLLKKA